MEAGETIRQAASREVLHPCCPRLVSCVQAASDATAQLLEEAGIAADGMTQRGVLTFLFDDRPQPWEVHGALTA